MRDAERILMCQSRTFYDLLWMDLDVCLAWSGHPRATVVVVEPFTIAVATGWEKETRAE